MPRYVLPSTGYVKRSTGEERNMAASYPRVEVKAGEASESDDDEDVASRNGVNSSRRPEKAVVVPGEASESEEEEIMTDGSSPHLQSGSRIVDGSPSNSHTSPSSSPRQQQSANYQSSLLHKKLKERNTLLRKRIVYMAQQPYVNAAKDMSAICQQLVKSQTLIQDVGPVLRQLTNNLFYLEDKLEITLDCAKLVPPIQMQVTTTTGPTSGGSPS